jgi:NAD(P)-dependent dehydrogenase (short-subunit alcohol dehydrogenase family)
VARFPPLKILIILASFCQVSVLINKSGSLFGRRRLTQDGLELTFALNHMAYFVLTEGLRKRLLASIPARIVNTASAAHQDATLDFDDLPIVARNCATSCLLGRSPAASPQIACIPVSSLRSPFDILIVCAVFP